MKARRTGVATKAYERALADPPALKCVLRLYVAGASARSSEALLRVRRMCDAEMKDAYELQVIDVLQQPILARDGQIIATPTLVRELPRPVRRLIGNLSGVTRLFVGLDVVTKSRTKR
jgi:circadian clock protein KaiB